MTTDRELLSCDGCIFCTSFNYSDVTRYLCNLGLDDIFHIRNGDIHEIGSKNINLTPTTPCKARYTDEEIQELLGV